MEVWRTEDSCSATHQLHPCSWESSWGLALLAWWKSSTRQAEQRARGDGGLNWHSGAGYSLTFSLSMCLIPLPSQASHSYKQKEQACVQIWPNGQHGLLYGPWVSGIFYLVLLLGRISDCAVDGFEGTDSSAQEQKKQPNNLLFLTATYSGTSNQTRITSLFFYFVYHCAAFITCFHISSK